MTSKVCPKCQQEKPLEAFDVDRSRADGRSYTCAKCRRLATKRWQFRNVAWLKNYHRQYIAKHRKHYNKLELARKRRMSPEEKASRLAKRREVYRHWAPLIGPQLAARKC
jgi:hypothetical protein